MKVLLTLILICGFQTANAGDLILTPNNHCSIEEQVTNESMQKAKFCLADKAAQRATRHYPLYLVLNSGGGSIYAGIRFISFAKTIKNLHTVTIYAASMASGIVEALPGKRYMTENGVYMFHRARGSFEGYFEDGELESQLAMWKSIVRKMETDNSKRIGITLRDYKEKVVREWWLYGQQAIDKNVADEIRQVKCSYSLIKARKTRTVKTLFGSYKVVESKCPLTN